GKTDKNFPDHFIFLKPKDVVSGDFYWGKESNNNLLIAASDCTGHGVSGALMSMLGISYLNDIIKHTPYNSTSSLKPSAILEKLRERVIKDLGQKETKPNKYDIRAHDGMDMALISIDLRYYKHPINNKVPIQYAGAKNPLYIVPPPSSNKDLKVIKPTPQTVGITYFEQKPFQNNELEIEKGSMLYIFTDGFPDQLGGKKYRKYKYSNFRKLLQNIAHLSIDQQKQALNREYKEWKGDCPQVDDICIVGVRVD
ncbi:MAG: PP2C family protein-serine/threonine phosphatase, partial [Flavobacteriales bacterium]